MIQQNMRKIALGTHIRTHGNGSFRSKYNT